MIPLSYLPRRDASSHEDGADSGSGDQSNPHVKVGLGYERRRVVAVVLTGTGLSGSASGST